MYKEDAKAGELLKEAMGKQDGKMRDKLKDLERTVVHRKSATFTGANNQGVNFETEDWKSFE